MARLIENHPNDGRVNFQKGNVCQTLLSLMGTGGWNVPMLLEEDDDLKDKPIEVYSTANGSHTMELYGVDVSPTLTERMGTGGNQIPVFVDGSFSSDKASTLRAEAGAIKHNADLKGRTIIEEQRIRKLTPIECERLQGLQDNWTYVEGRGDSPRYKAIGNGMAQPCADFVLRRIAEVSRHS